MTKCHFIVKEPRHQSRVGLQEGRKAKLVAKQMEDKDNMHLGASPIVFLRAKELRHKMTDAEKLLWEELKNKKLNGLKFRNQHPIMKYILDFYCHEHKLGIEIDGEIHNNKAQQYYDIDRTENLEEFGIRILRFTNEEIYKDIELVKRKIVENLGGSIE